LFPEQDPYLKIQEKVCTAPELLTDTMTFLGRRKNKSRRLLFAKKHFFGYTYGTLSLKSNVWKNLACHVHTIELQQNLLEKRPFAK
jgi:hypothetical protein